MSESNRLSARWRRRTAVLHRRTAYGPLVLTASATSRRLLAGDPAAVWSLLDEPATRRRSWRDWPTPRRREPTGRHAVRGRRPTSVAERASVETLATLRRRRDHRADAVTLVEQLTGGHDARRRVAAPPRGAGHGRRAGAASTTASPLDERRVGRPARAPSSAAASPWTLLDATVTGDLPPATRSSRRSPTPTAPPWVWPSSSNAACSTCRPARSGRDRPDGDQGSGRRPPRLGRPEPARLRRHRHPRPQPGRDGGAADPRTARASTDRCHRMRPILDRVFAKGATLDDPDGYEVDLHRTLTPGSFGLAVPEAELWADREPFALGGVTLHALAPATRLTHTAAHHRLGSPVPMLSTARDLLRQVGLVPVDAGASVAETARADGGPRRRAPPCAGRGLRPAGRWLDWSATVEVDDDEQRRLAEHDAAGGAYRAQALGSLRDVPWRWRGGGRVQLGLPVRPAPRRPWPDSPDLPARPAAAPASSR